MIPVIHPEPLAPEEYYQAGLEPIALFEINIRTAFSPPAIYFKGASQVGPFTHKAGFVNERTRTPDSRPIAAGVVSAPSADFTSFGLPPLLQTFTNNRLNALLVEYAGLPSGPSLPRRNLVRRIGHILGCLQFLNPSDPTIATVQAKAVAPDVFTIRQGSDPVDWQSMEQYTGKSSATIRSLG
jgi:hypothetical protein